MKKLSFVILLALSGCGRFGTKQQKTEHLVKLYLDSTLNDKSSYEPISTKIDTFWNNVLSDSAYSKAFSKSISVESSIKFEDNLKIKKGLLLESKELERKMKAIGDTFKNKPNGWMVTHNYRAKNGLGALGIHTITVHINKDYSNIIEVMNNK